MIGSSPPGNSVKRPCTYMDVTLLLGGDFSWLKKVRHSIRIQMN